jgi:hypothetical protein
MELHARSVNGDALSLLNQTFAQYKSVQPGIYYERSLETETGAMRISVSILGRRENVRSRVIRSI